MPSMPVTFRPRRARMSERGLEFMRGRDPASSDAQFAEAVEAILAGKEFAAPESQPLYSAPAALAEFDAASLAPGAAGKRHPWRAAARRAMYLAARAAQYVRSGR